jgi:hypothetical protein
MGKMKGAIEWFTEQLFENFPNAPGFFARTPRKNPKKKKVDNIKILLGNFLTIQRISH